MVMREEEKDKALAYMQILTLLNNYENKDKTEDDKTFRKNTKEQITKRDEKYTDLLSHFVEITKIRNQIKEFVKWS